MSGHTKSYCFLLPFFLLSVFSAQLSGLAQALPPAEKIWPKAEDAVTHDLWYFKDPWVAMDPHHPGVLFAYVSGTFLKSGDFGKSWKRIGKGLPENAVFNSPDSLFPCPISFSPFIKETILLGANRESVGGVPFRSDDGGETWYPMNICENGPGYFRNNFKFSATSSGIFSSVDKDTIFFPVLSESACQPVFVSLDGGTSIVPNPQCPYYKQQCKNPLMRNYCADNSACFNYGGNYWGGDMLISLNPAADEMFEFDFHGSLGQDYIARSKKLDRKSGQLCTASNVVVDLDTVPGRKLTGEGYFKSPAFFTREDEMFAVCDIVQTGTSDGRPVYGKTTRPFLARCGGKRNGSFVFSFVSFLPEGYDSIVTDLKKAGSMIIFSSTDKDLVKARFLAWNSKPGGGWVKFGEEGAPFFSILSTPAGVDVYYIICMRDPSGSVKSLLKVIHLDTETLTYRTETRYDFTNINTGLSSFHIEDPGNVRKFWGRNIHTFRGVDGVMRYALLRSAELDYGKDPDKLVLPEGQENLASFDLGFSGAPIVTACTSNFSSLVVDEKITADGPVELWAYLSSDAGIWRNRKFHKPFSQEHPYELLLAFENISGGYDCKDGCAGQIPAKDFGNYCRKVVLDKDENGKTVLFAACRSGLWKGKEQDDKSFFWTIAYDPSVKTGPDAGVRYILKSGCYFFIITSEGLFRSQDLTSWNNIYKPDADFGPVTAVSSFPGDSPRLVIAQGSGLYFPGNGGIFVSEDHGETWRQSVKLDPSSELPVKKMECVSENGRDTVYYLTANGILNRITLEVEDKNGNLPLNLSPPTH